MKPLSLSLFPSAYIYLAGYLNDLLLPQVPQALDVNLFVCSLASCQVDFWAEAFFLNRLIWGCTPSSSLSQSLAWVYDG